jgi:hypothetical protein
MVVVTVTAHNGVQPTSPILAGAPRWLPMVKDLATTVVLKTPLQPICYAAGSVLTPYLILQTAERVGMR